MEGVKIGLFHIEKEVKNIKGLYLASNYISGVSVGHCNAEATKLTGKIKNQT